MLKQIALLSITLSLATPSFAQESKDQACQGINKLKCSSGGALIAGGVASTVDSQFSNARIAKTTGSLATVDMHHYEYRRLERHVNNALPDDRIELIYQMDPEVARLERIKALEINLQQVARDIGYTENALRIATDSANRGSQTAAFHRDEAAKRLQSLKAQLSAEKMELAAINSGKPIASEHLIGRQAFTGKERSKLLAFVNQNNQSRGFIMEIKIVRPYPNQARALARNVVKSKGGVAAIALGATVLIHEAYTSNAESEISATSTEISSRTDFQEPKSLKERIQERNSKIEAATGVN